LTFRPALGTHHFTMEQSWLTLDQISFKLRLGKSYIKELTRQKFLVTIGNADKKRWLDPTPDYAQQLRLAAILHSRALFVPPDISEIALLTLREVAILCNWTLRYAQVYMHRNPQVPRFKVNSQLSLYSIRTVREILWRRQGHKAAHQRSPFLIMELVRFVQKEHEAATRDVPTDAEYAADDKIMRKLEAIVTRSEADQAAAKNDFARKAELARRIVQILDSAKRAQ
jgi:hypothetical protein